MKIYKWFFCIGIIVRVFIPGRDIYEFTTVKKIQPRGGFLIVTLQNKSQFWLPAAFTIVEKTK